MREPVLVGSMPDEKRRECFDCAHCQLGVSWFCVDEDAINARASRIPNADGCEFWAPCAVSDTAPKSPNLVAVYRK